MTALSTAVSLERVSAIVGYEAKATLAGIKAGNLPQRIAVIAEANTANQTGLPVSFNFVTSDEVGDQFGYGSPAHICATILRPKSGDKLGGIPTVIYPVAEAAAATATVITNAIVGTATKNITHSVEINGRSYPYAVAKGDTATELTPKIIDAVNNILKAPVIGTNVTDKPTWTTKWNGATSVELNVVFNVNGDSAGLTYSEDSKVDGAGLPDIDNALNNFGDVWNTFVINALGTDETTLDKLEAFNGSPYAKTGRFDATIFKPFIAYTGTSLDTLTAITAISDGRKNEMTNKICPLPNTIGWTFEGAADEVFVYAPIAQDTPQSDIVGALLKNTVAPKDGDIGDFSNPTSREQIIRVGSSTVTLNSGSYEIVDPATTAHPDNEPQTAVLYRWVRDLIGIDWNIRYKYMLLEQANVINKTIVPDTSTSTAADTISPKRWKGKLYKLADDLEADGLIASAQLMKDTLQVQIGESNPNRLETVFDVERTGISRVLSTTNNTRLRFGG